MLPKLLLLAVVLARLTVGQYLTPQHINLAANKTISATATCGIKNGLPYREMFCYLGGASKYNPSPISGFISEPQFAALSIEEEKPTIQGGQNCEICDASVPHLSHLPEKMIDQLDGWWQSPPLSRGMEYNQINITVDLGQEFHVAFVNILMANSPRPALWVLERSSDYGKTYQPWQYFAENSQQCVDFFGQESIQPLQDDDSVICSTEYSQIVPLENGEIIVRLVSGRPGSQNFTHSEKLQNFIKATNVRIRLLRTKTLHGHLMDLNDRTDQTISRRYFYAIKEILMGGRCVCNGHAQTCDILDPLNRPNKLLCRCEHNTCGDQCERCCSGYEQKQWRSGREGLPLFVCEPCNCYGHSEDCDYDPEIDRQHLSVDIHGKHEGGGVCKNCRDNTEGINCNKCSFGYFRPHGRELDDPHVCQRCSCDPYYHTGGCTEGDGICECRPRFRSPRCDACTTGYYDYPQCKPCECHVNGTTSNDICLPTNGQCPCKPNYAGVFCNECADGSFMFPECKTCKCSQPGSLNNVCDKRTGQCQCRTSYSNISCDICGDGFYQYPECKYCDCDQAGAEPSICDKSTGQCLCKPGFAGDRCDRCSDSHYRFPDCKPCDCDVDGSMDEFCHSQSGQCKCKPNFTGQHCSKCTAGYFDYPRCTACNCDRHGSVGITCNDRGACFCRGNFEGTKCDRCKPNFYNLPLCEECNCDPRGVSRTFAGCDKVPTGELCTCKERVAGRICNECKPTFWNLQHYNELGCDDCSCNLAGTLSRLNDCDDTSGQCQCKLLVGGRNCSSCRSGYYSLSISNQFGCQACDCDVGGSFSQICDDRTGQCRCKGRVTGRACTQPIEAHYFPTLLHMQYEAEDGRTPGNTAVRFASGQEEFPNFSWRGFAVFSHIQDEIWLYVDVPKSSIYRLLLHYINPNNHDVTTNVEFEPHYVDSADDVKQTLEVKLPPTESGQTTMVPSETSPHPFVLNAGRWILRLKSKQKLYLDYAVLVPAAYFEAAILREDANNPCLASDSDSATCKYYKYADIDFSTKAFDPSIVSVDPDGTRHPVQQFPGNQLPAAIGTAAWLQGNKKYAADINIEKPGNYVVVFDYFNMQQDIFPSDVQVEVHDYKKSGGVTFHYCPYNSFCREVTTTDGQPTVFSIPRSGTVNVNIQPNKELDMALHSITAVPQNEWRVDYLLPKVVCVRRGKECLGSEFLNPTSAVRMEAEADPNFNFSVEAESLPFTVADKTVRVLPLDNNLHKFDMVGDVRSSEPYVFMVHYFNPHLANAEVDVGLLNERNYEVLTGKQFNDNATVDKSLANAHLSLPYCPSVSGCRAVIKDKGTDAIAFDLSHNQRYLISFMLAKNTSKAAYIDYVSVVPFMSYSEDVLEPVRGERAGIFLNRCLRHFTDSGVNNVDDYCKSQIFSLTMDNNMGAMPCECDLQGSTSLTCQSFGGQCPCRPNVIGRTCTQCKAGTYGFPDCKPCNCPRSQHCDPQTGQCFCPLHVEGQTCSRCVSHAYGYDPLIGCQECSCNREGTDGSIDCDQLTGQCRCKTNIAGRTCDRCVSGYYGFPHCYQCNCIMNGTVEEICDQNSAKCLCKTNAQGLLCESCVDGTYYLEGRNPKGCTDCFCFGVTSSCHSSNLRNYQIVDTRGWTVFNAENANVEDGANFVRATFQTGEPSQPGAIYFSAPVNYLGKRLTSYGGKLRYKITSTSFDANQAMSIAPDVILRGNDITLEYWSVEQPADFSQPFPIEVDLLPEQWRVGRSPATRAQLMMALNRLTDLRIKASYFEKISEARLLDIGLDAAVEGPASVEDVAANIEKCQCPAPYKGLSCEECAEGYYRIATGPFLGTCVPCQCHGHSHTCDPDTGVCHNCLHNTFGEHCEQCNVGHYGNATRGTPFDCSVCACPHQSNNFAVACDVTDSGLVLACHCREGYSGDRCENCATGWFGNPLRPGEQCERCACNDNNDLAMEGSCDPRTGFCYLCQHNTTGPYCEICAEWYHGEAINAKNCAPCTCDQCGSAVCDHESGQCLCKPHVEGSNCDRCVANAWGFSRCAGCQMCDCAPASVLSQCDRETGQCACMPGATGQRCDQCKAGYWNYSPSGCQKCDCEWDLSVGTVCDVNTGRCQCMPGATGPRCDQCLENFLRIPDRGCFFCDQCVHVLVGDLDTLEMQITKSENDLRGISTLYLTNRRLNRINDTIFEQQAKIRSLISSESDTGLTNVISEGRRVRNLAEDLRIQSGRSFSIANDTETRLIKLEASSYQLSSDIWVKVTASRDAIMKVRGLVLDLQPSTSPRHSDDFVHEGELVLAQMNRTDLRLRYEAAQLALLEANETLQEFLHRKSLRQKLENSTDDVRSKWANISAAMSDYRLQLRQNHLKLDKTTTLRHEVLANPLYISGFKIGFDTTKARENVGNASKFNEDAKSIAAELSESFKSINTSLQHLNSSSATIQTRLKDLEDSEEDVMRLGGGAEAKADELELTATQLSSNFNGTKNASQHALDAANAYKKIAEALDEAQRLATEANNNFLQITLSDGIETQAADMEGAAIKLHREAIHVRHDAVNKLRAPLQQNNQSLQRLNSNSDGLRHQLSEHDDPIRQVTGMREDVYAKLNASVQLSKEVNQIVQHVNETIAKMNNQINKLRDTSKDAVYGGVYSERDLKDAKSQIEKIIPDVPKVLGNLSWAKSEFDRISLSLNNVTLLLESLKDKVNKARNLVNRVPFGASFTDRSSLQVENPSGFSRSSAYSLVSMYFNTAKPDGLLFFVGNPVGTSRTRVVPTDDYMALEVVEGRLKLTYDLGAGPASVSSETHVADGQWHKVTVERTNKIAALTVESEDKDPEVRQAYSTGRKALMDLHQDSSKFFVGGVPLDVTSQMPPTLRNYRFEGKIEDVKFNGQTVGLWNFAKDGRVETDGAVKRSKLLPKDKSVTGVHLNRQGYVEMQKGHWNPRRKTIVKLHFKTYALNGLIFYIGGKGDFFAIELRNGSVLVQFNCGGGAAHIMTSKTYNDGQWHMIDVNRDNKTAKLTMDMDESSSVTGTAPGSHNDLDVGEVYFVGGVKIPHRLRDVSNQGFHGCIEKVHVDGTLVNLNNHISAAFIEPGCEPKPIRVISIDGDGGWVQISPLQLTANIELTFRFKTKKQNALIMWLVDDTESNNLAITIESGRLIIISTNNGGEALRMKEESKDYADGAWHFVTATRKADMLLLDVDDFYSVSTNVSIVGTFRESNTASLYFGSPPSRALPQKMAAVITPFVGCVGDLAYNLRLLDFKDSIRADSHVSLVGCPLPDPVQPTVSSLAVDAGVDSDTYAASQLSGVPTLTGGTDGATEAPIDPPITKMSQTLQVVVDDQNCALRANPVDPIDSRGYRLGRDISARLEYNTLPGPIEKKANISFEFRASSTNGVILYISNNDKIDYLAIFMKNSRLVFSFDCGSGPAILESKRTFLDHNWHSVFASRDGKRAWLFVDQHEEATGTSKGSTDVINIDRPLFIGGLPTEFFPTPTKRHLNSIVNSFGGCLRDFKLGDEPLGEPTNQYNVAQCSDFFENGIYFGARGGYSILQNDTAIGNSFSFEIELKPRVRNAVLLAISSHTNNHFLTLQMINGILKFSVNGGNNPQHVTNAFDLQKLELCDGHWHIIKVVKIKNVMSLSVDGITKTHIIKKMRSLDIHTKDTLYFGGVPATFDGKGLDAKNSFVGCVRRIKIQYGKHTTRRRKQTQVNFDDLTIFGDVTKGSCPVN